ncbi:MAG TPA: rhomboid family intramembrane serine protease [Blastocatellia bacterium]|nr:rhomboid family intramembrane serine protease [Blastocatellia bacterium]
MLFPIGDDNSSRRVAPVVTYGLIALNVIVFLIEMSQGEPFIRQWSVVPRQLVANPVEEIPTIFTSMFMHGGWMHLLGNMLFLWIFGDNVEARLGRARYLAFYLACGVAATLAQVAVSSGSNIPNLGASGAISGVLGAYLILFPQGRVRVLMRGGTVAVPALVVIGLWILLQLVNGIGSITHSSQTGGVAYMAHIGGFVVGMALAYLLTGKSLRILASR